MGTLTANTRNLPEYCLHKLPSSCRLTATPECCACQDKRSHAPTYSTYVDGVGMVSRGTRWQRYCWFCKEFWENRVHLDGFDPKQTRVPDTPNQTEFCRQWFDFHRGYKNIHNDDGSESTQPVTPELSWQDTAPGYLPLFRQPASNVHVPDPVLDQSSTPYIPIEQALDEMLNGFDEDSTDTSSTGLRQTDQPHARYAMHSPRTNPLPTGEQLREARVRLEEAESRHRQLRDDLASAHTELRACRERQRQLTTARQTARNLERVFGTREEFLQQGANYVSPVSALFTRAQAWYQTAEEVRRAERDSNLNEERHQQILASFGQQDFVSRIVNRARHEAEEEEEAATRHHPRSLDDDRIARPPPKTDAEMSVSLACKICLQQVSDTAVLPCGHLIMCGCCATIAMPTKDEAQTQPARRNAQCPLCRKPVKRVAKIYLS